MSHHILVVEDEPDINKTVSYNLANEGFHPVSALNLKEADDQLSSNNISLIILDLMLPDGSGLDFCKTLKSSNIYKNIPVIIVTAKGDEVDKVVGFELGADDYVTKPFSVRELMLRIKAILKRNTQAVTTKSNSVISFDGLNVNEESHEVYVNDVEINLTALEFKLLKHLLDRRGRVQTRDQLLEEVWGYSSHVTTRTVDTHVKRLREKLKEMGKHIQTIRGVGYRFSRSSD